MRKANAQPRETAPLTISEDALTLLAEHATLIRDKDRTQIREELESIERGNHQDRDRIESRRRDIADIEREIEQSETWKVELTAKMEALPPIEPTTVAEVRENLMRVLSLPFVKNLEVHERELRRGGSRPAIVERYLVITTREHTLFTTLNKKFSAAERWYRAKPYKIPLPAYKIYVGMTPASSYALNERALALELADHSADTAHWARLHRYSQQPHAHWATSGHSSEPKGVCLGEYESEVSRAFRASTYDGLVALATFLQMSGADSGFIHTRHEWALWMGKREYNIALIPSITKTEPKEIVVDETEEVPERFNADGDPDPEGEYDADGDLIDF